MKNETWVASEYHFVLDIVQSTLTTCQFTITMKDKSRPFTIIVGVMTEGSICQTMINVDSKYNSSLTHLLTLCIKDRALIRRVADFLKDGRLSCIGSPCDKNAAGTLLSDFPHAFLIIVRW